ncbi:MAG: nucleotidyltransferase domain-containing protein [Chlamydiales bacterium]|nr:nucleotidyltransferase domain-containing protein [Chlamydiales bacterium]
MYGLKDSDLEEILSAFKKHPNITEAILFGSRAKGTQRPGSDVDIALKGNNLEQTVLQLSIALNQESLMPYDFDLINYNTIDNQDLIDHINRVGKSIYP